MEEKIIKKPFYKKWWFWVIAIILFISFVNSLGDNEKEQQNILNNDVDSIENSPIPTKTPIPKEPIIKITAEKLFEESEANEVAFDVKYKGKQVEVTGIINSIGKDILDTPYVSLETNNLISIVQCMFSKNDIGKLSLLQKNSKITINGTVDGKLLNIIIRKSEIVE